MEDKEFWVSNIMNGGMGVGKYEDFLITCEFQQENIYGGRGNKAPMHNNIYQKYLTNTFVICPHKENQYFQIKLGVLFGKYMIL